jgi:hypothetical protein
MCDDKETRDAIELHAWLLANPVQARAAGFTAYTVDSPQLRDIFYIETPQGDDHEARVLAIACQDWRAADFISPDRVMWNPLPPDGVVCAYELFTRRRLLH